MRCSANPSSVGCAATFSRREKDLQSVVKPLHGRLRLHDRRPQAIPVGLLLDVLSADGESYWVGRGWVAQAEVVALDEGGADLERAARLASIGNRT